MHIKQTHVTILVIVLSFQQASCMNLFGKIFCRQGTTKYRERIELHDATKPKQTPKSPEPKQEQSQDDMVDKVIHAFFLSKTRIVQDDEIYQYPVGVLPFP